LIEGRVVLDEGRLKTIDDRETRREVKAIAARIRR